MSQLQFKRGDTFKAAGVLKFNGVPESLVGWTIRSQIRNAKQLVAELDVTITDAPNGKYELKGVATEGWPATVAPGYKLSWDIEYTDPSGVIVSTKTLDVFVLEDVTQ